MVDVHDELTPDLSGRIERFLAASDAACGACGEHDPRWLRVLREGLGHRPRVIVSRDESGAINGYLPLVLVAGRLFGKFLVSLPYINRAGVVAADDGVAAALVDRACELADELDVKYLELRHHAKVIEHAKLGFRRDEKHRMVLSLPASEDALWKSIGAKVRNQIRKGDKSELSIRWASYPDHAAALDGFYDVFAVNMRDLGTPVFGRRLFEKILEAFGDAAELAVVSRGEQVIATALLVHDPAGPGRVASTQVPSASALRAYNSTNANMWMYHQLLLRAMARGSGAFDFGRSSEGSGTYRFKKQWGAEPQSTVWQYYIRKGDVNAMRPDSAKNQRRVEIWKKLPVWLTRLAGPHIVRGIP